MNEEFTRFGLVAMARQILDMNDEIEFLRGENARLQGFEEKYREEVSGSIRHSQAMIGGILKMVLVPGVMDAIDANREVAS